jgi:acyl-coenzyme A synthetase/AMP-(fatty) acid ligase
LRPAAAIRDKKISVWQSVPSVLDLMLRGKQLTSEYLSGLRVMSFCGEPLRREQLEALFKAHPGLTVFNTYGATETIGFNTLNELRRDTFVSSCDGNSAAIGEDVPGWSLHLRGGHDENEGEIVVASEFLSLGYWCDEERTRSSFRQVDLGGSRSERCYFTGDLGVRRGGRLYCAGRMDRQVKIRGERVELEEIDGLLRSAGFPAAYTICKDGELYSFVESTQSLDQEQIRGRLQESLPFHAIPRTIYALASLSRNQSGKVDREALYREIER